MSTDAHELLMHALETEPADEGVEAAWQAEVESRAAEVDRGEAKTLPCSEVHRRMMNAGRGQAR